MIVVVSIETVLLVFVGLLLVGVLRSHAEILRVANLYGDVDRGDQAMTSLEEIPQATMTMDGHRPLTRVTKAIAVSGHNLDGEVRAFSLSDSGEQNTLLAFLSSGCLACEPFWGALSRGERERLPARTRVLVVSKSLSDESPSRLTQLAGKGANVVMSSQAWEDYRIPQSPYFVFVEGATARVRGQGSASTWDQMVNLLLQGIDDAAVFKSLPDAVVGVEESTLDGVRGSV